MAAMAQSNIASVDDVELVMGTNAQPNQIYFHVLPETSLTDAAELKLRTRGGTGGFIVGNAELLDMKCWTKDAVERNLKMMIRDCEQAAQAEITEIDLLITTLKTRLQGQVPQRGTQLINRGKGIRNMIYPASRYGQFPEYSVNAPDVVDQDANQAARDAARASDIVAQYVYWNANVEVLEAKKAVIQAKARELGDVLRAKLDKLLDSRSLLGSGYTSLTFLSRPGDVNLPL